MKKLESEKHESKAFQQKGLKVMWPRSILLKNWDLCAGMYGSMDAELEVQRTIMRAELTAFLCLLKK